MRTVIISDLTRFTNKDIVCTAAIDVATGECLRPMPYLTRECCKRLNIQPGAILRGEFHLKRTSAPHQEDATYNGLTYYGSSTSEDFKSTLEKTLSSGVSTGFGIDLSENEKLIPFGYQANCSIITIAIKPDRIQIHEDEFKSGKVKLTFIDNNGHKFSYLPVTDQGFSDYALNHLNTGKLRKIQNFIVSQDEIFLRIGLSRFHRSPDGRNGFWLQVNGIYTFPEYMKEIRSYS